jgi:lysophospholipase L1-like esterase
MSPKKNLVLLVSVLGILTALSFVVPKDGFTVLGYTVRFPTFEKFMSYQPVVKKDISKITDRLALKLKKIQADSTKKHKNANLDGSTIGADTSAEAVDEAGLIKLTFGKDQQDILHGFFAKLSTAAGDKKNIRIIHYGDSQIEGDRFTGYLRNKIQSKFGGFGPGMIPFMNVYPTNSFKQTASSHWKRFTTFPGYVKSVKHKRYGAMNSFARFTPVINDSSYLKNAETEASIVIGKSKSAYGTAQTFNRVKIYYGNCKVPVSVNVYNNDELIHTDTLKYDGATHSFELTFSETPENLKYVFKGKDSPDFYCFVLDGAYGVGVDNVAMRGSSGTFVTTGDMSHLKLFYDQLGTELFVMQFGGNAVPYLKDSSQAYTIANYFSSQLQALKRLRPGCAIIVIGPSDMSGKIGGEWKTYPLLPAFVGMLRQASYKAGAAYWDIYQAMGGENSMLTWVEKGLAGPDYTHFTPGGAKFVAEMFYEAFIFEYNKYLKKKKEL